MDKGIVRCLSEVSEWSEVSFRGGGWVAIGKVRGLSEVGKWLQILSYRDRLRYTRCG